MSAFRRGGAKKRRDANEPQIVQALRAVGCETWQLSGTGLPDLLVRRAGMFYAMEVKTAKGGMTEAQAAIPWPVVRSVEDALTVVGVGR